jgi:flagellar hook-associated protein 2
MSTSVDGLISGMNTTQVIGQLMQVEAQQQTGLKQKVQDQKTVLQSLQSVNSKVSALKSAADKLILPMTWQAAKAASTSDSVTATAKTGAPTGSWTFNVNALATAQSSTAVVASTGSIMTDPTAGVQITVGGVTTQVDVATDTAQGVVDAINKKALGINASLVTTQQGTVLQLASTKTGVDNAFSVGGINAAFTNINEAANAEIGVGAVGAGGYTVQSPSNSFSNVIPDVTVNVSKVENGVTVATQNDSGSVADSVQAMISAANSTLSEIGTQGQYATTDGSQQAGPLAANFTITSMSGDILSTVSGGMANYGSFKQMGIELTKDGQLTFDRDAFLAAYNADPAKVQDAVAGGLAKSLSAFGDTANKNITSAIQNGNDNVRSLNDQISNWDVQLQLRQQALQKQFSDMEVSLGQLRDQSNWLSGQIAKLG